MIRKILCTLAAALLLSASNGVPANAETATPTPPGAQATNEGKSTSVDPKLIELQDDSGKPASQFACEQRDGKFFCKPLESDRIVLNTNNLITLQGPIDGPLASKFVEDFQALENRDEVNKIYVFIRSPGGSIFAGDAITDIIQSSKKQVVVIVDFAASMAFHIAMAGNKRVIQPTGTLMQHHASGGTGAGQFPNVDHQWQWIKDKVHLMNVYDASRCKNTTYDQFMKNIDRDWWLLAPQAQEAGCVDQVAKAVTCSKDLIDSTRTDSISFFGMTISIVWSGCPLEVYPRKVALMDASGYRPKLNAAQAQAVEDFLILLSDPLRFYQKYNTFETTPLQDAFTVTKATTPSL